MSNTYIIGEIGQNHNGSVDLAKILIDVVARPVDDKLFGEKLRGMDAVKLTKRDLAQELSTSQMKKEYNSVHSFGKTYGEHREYLELQDEQHLELYNYTKLLGIDFIETFCAKGSLSLLKLFTPDRIKVASRDLTNLPLLMDLADTKIPIILSTGMASKKELDDALDVIVKIHSEISILHCVSEYPTQYKNVNLKTIKYLIDNYSQYTIGYSDHTIGIATPIAAVAMGAKIIEKHITIDRKLKGTDHIGSLAIDGIERLVRDIRNLELSMGEESIYVCDDVSSSREKLERSIASKISMKKGTVINENDIHLLSPGNGYKWVDRYMVIGKIVIKDIEINEIIYNSNIE
jgi:3-deoxy-D-glycero-D-galacto-nononate 9-phosphate synthase